MSSRETALPHPAIPCTAASFIHGGDAERMGVEYAVENTGNPSTLFNRFGQLLRPVAKMTATHLYATSGEIRGLRIGIAKSCKGPCTNKLRGGDLSS